MTLRVTGSVVVCLAALLAATEAAAQDRRDLMNRAVITPVPADRAQLFAQTLNLNLGPPDSLWAEAVMALVQDLQTNLGDPAGAQLWLRWAVRYYPNLRDFANPGWDDAALGTLDQVLVELAGAPTESVATWDFTGVRLGSDGTIRLNRSGLRDAVVVRVESHGRLTDQLSLEPGTYTVRVSADGQELMAFDREVLPGVTTSLNIAAPVAARLAEIAAGQLAGPMGGEQIPVVGAGGGGFPAALVVALLGAAGGAAFLILGGSSNGSLDATTDGPTTGGFIIRFSIR